MDLEGTDGLDGTGVESPIGTKCDTKTPKCPRKKRKGSKVGGTEDVTLNKDDLDNIADVIASISEDRWTVLEEKYKATVESLHTGLQVL